MFCPFYEHKEMKIVLTLNKGFGDSWEALFCVTCYVGELETLGLLLGAAAAKQQWVVSC